MVLGIRASNFPNFRVTPGTYSFRWLTGVDGVASGTTVEIEVLPVGATLGTAFHFIAVVP